MNEPRFWTRREVERYAAGVIDSYLEERARGTPRVRASARVLAELAGALDRDEANTRELEPLEGSRAELDRPIPYRLRLVRH